MTAAPSPKKPTAHWKVGELAARTGVSVRALHHYHAIGLLSPSHRTPSGHRLYTAADVARLQQIKSLRSLGLSLDEVRACLRDRAWSPERVVRLHLARVRERVALEQQLCRRLEALAAALDAGRAASVEAFFQTLEAITMTEKQFTPEQMEKIKAQGAKLGEARIREVEAEWPRLIAEARAAMQAGEDPAGPAVQRLAERWRALVREFTGGDPGIERTLEARYEREDPAVVSHGALDREVFEFMAKAQAAMKKG